MIFLVSEAVMRFHINGMAGRTTICFKPGWEESPFVPAVTIINFPEGEYRHDGIVFSGLFPDNLPSAARILANDALSAYEAEKKQRNAR